MPSDITIGTRENTNREAGDRSSWQKKKKKKDDRVLSILFIIL